MSPPKVAEKLIPVLSPDQRDALLKTCKGNDFTNRRDMAILRLFLATGIRLAEMTGILVADVDMDRRLVRVEGKGRRERIVRFDGGTAVAIDRYERSRSVSKHAERPELWLAEKNRGVLTRTGIYQLVVRRGEMIGLDLNPHMFRRTFSHVWLEHGGAEGDLMDLNGWKSPQMLRRYGASARAERARTAYDRIDVMRERRP